MYTTLAIAATIRVDIVIYINKLKNKAKLASIPRHRFSDRDREVCCRRAHEIACVKACCSSDHDQTGLGQE